MAEGSRDGVEYPLSGGVSSFGAGGSNAHVILESYAPVERGTEEASQPRELIFPLSAKGDEQLREAAARLSTFLQRERVNLGEVACTLKHGRKSFDHRLAIVASTNEELVEKLAAFMAGKKAEGIATGHVKSAEAITRLLNRREKEEFIRLLSQGRDPQKIAGLWAEGLLADWQGFQPGGSETGSGQNPAADVSVRGQATLGL